MAPQDDWEELLPLGKFSHNDHVHSSIKQSPFMVNTGRNPHMGFEPQQPRLTLESVNDLMDHMAQGLEEANAALAKAKDKYMMCYNHQYEPVPVFSPGNKVWMEVTLLPTDHYSSCLIDDSGHLQSKPASDMEPTAFLCHPSFDIYILYSLLSSCP
jgi:hypothetical protein